MNAEVAETQDLPPVFAGQTSIEVITFYEGQTQYATPVSAVRYIEQDRRKTTRIEFNKELGAEVTTYQNKPVPIFDFAGLMGCEAEYIKNIKLMQLLDDHEKDHRNWMISLEESLRSGSEFTLARDPNLCKFGQWYNDFKSEDELLADIMEDFDGPHRHIHAPVDRLLAMRDAGEQEEALVELEKVKVTSFVKLMNLFKAAKDRIENITRPILIFIDTESKMVAIRLNAISDIVTYQVGSFTSKDEVDDSSELNELNFLAGYLENKNDAPPCVLLDWRLFKGKKSAL